MAIAEELKNLQAKGVVTVIMDSDFKGELTRPRILHRHQQHQRRQGTRQVRGCASQGRRRVCDVLRSLGGAERGRTLRRLRRGSRAGVSVEGFARRQHGPHEGQENVRNALQNHPDIKTLVGIWSYNAPAIVDVVREAGTRKDVTIVVTDAERSPFRRWRGG